MYSNFGEIGVKIKELMDEFQKKSKSQKKVESIADMKVNETFKKFKLMNLNNTLHMTAYMRMLLLVLSSYILYTISFG